MHPICASHNFSSYKHQIQQVFIYLTWRTPGPFQLRILVQAKEESDQTLTGLKAISSKKISVAR
jgi:hypothetical protein